MILGAGVLVGAELACVADENPFSLRVLLARLQRSVPAYGADWAHGSQNLNATPTYAR